MRLTEDGYIVGRSRVRVLWTLTPGLLLLIALVGLLMGFGPGPHTPLFNLAVGLSAAAVVVGEWIILSSAVHRSVLLATSAAGVTHYPVRYDPYFVPWAQIASIGVQKRYLGDQVMRSLVLTLRPSAESLTPDGRGRISIPAHQLPTRPQRCVQLLAERHREQIAIHGILVLAKPQFAVR